MSGLVHHRVASASGGHLRFGDYVAIPESEQLLRSDSPVALQSQPFQVLLALLEPGQVVVSRHSLISRLWPSRDLEDDVVHQSADRSLDVAMTKLRRALGDDARWIVTLRGKGFQYVGPNPEWVAAEDNPREHPLDETPGIDQLNEKRSWRIPLGALVRIGAVVAAFLVVGLAASYWRSDRNPTDARRDGDAVAIINKDGDTLWRIPLAERRKGYYDNIPEPTIHPLWFGDFIGDDRNEVLFVDVPNSQRAGKSTLRCYTGRSKECWEGIELGKERNYAGRHHDSAYTGGTIGTYRLQGRSVVVAAATHTWFPTALYLIDPLNGARLGEFWHPGSFASLVPMDLDSDGTDEIIAGGINNPNDGHGHPIVAVLDLPTEDYDWAYDDSTDHLGRYTRRYLVFPRSPLNDKRSEEPRAWRVEIIENDRIHFVVGGAAVHYYFDSAFNLTAAYLSSDLKNQHATEFGEAMSLEEVRRLQHALNFDIIPDANSPHISAMFEQCYEQGRGTVGSGPYQATCMSTAASPTDPVASARVEDGRLLLRHVSGNTTRGEPDSWLHPAIHAVDRVASVLLVEDVDDDGRPDILSTGHDPQTGDLHLRCYDDTATLRWTTPFGETLDTPDGTLDNTFHLDTVQHIAGLVVAEGRHNTRFASVVQLIDPVSGSVIDRYLHPGELNILAPMDIDGDEIEELVVAGVYNPGSVRGIPGMAVLDLPFQQYPRAPGEPENYLGPENRKERQYLMLPSIDVGRLSEQMNEFGVRFHTTRGLRIDNVVKPHGAVVLTFDSDLSLIEAVVNRELRKAHAELVLQGHLDHELSAEEEGQWTKIRRFSTAPPVDHLVADGLLQDYDFTN